MKREEIVALLPEFESRYRRRAAPTEADQVNVFQL